MPVVDLKGKRVVITGAGRGIGAACARAAAAMGARVVVNDVDEALALEVVHGIRQAGGQGVAHAADITNWAQAQGLIDRCVSEFGGIDGLVNNAGLFQLARIDELTEAGSRAIMEVNVMGTIFCTAHAIRHMLAANDGAIVNITSGAQCGMAAMGVYGASKGAVASLTYSWAVDLAASAVRVNAVSPMGATRMGQINQAYNQARGAPHSPNVIPPENNAPLICYLLSDASRGIAGQVVRIQGNRLSLMSHPAVLEPVQQRAQWTADAIAQAFDDVLAAHAQPTGVVTVTQQRSV